MQEGEVVWAKVRGHPEWPGTVSEEFDIPIDRNSSGQEF